MTTLNSFYAQAAAVTNPDQRRWALGAAYRIGEYVSFGYSVADARALVLASTPYANGLVAATLDDDYALIDDTGGGGGGPPPATTYADEVLADGPAGYWRLGDAAASATAAAVVGTAGTVVGGVTFGQAGAIVGNADTAAAFNGSTGLVNIAAQNVAVDKTFSHECWFKGVTANTNQYMTAETSTASNNPLVGLALNLGKVQGLIRDDANVAVTLTSPLTYNDNAYHYAALTSDGTTARLYVDGSEVANGAISTLGVLTLNAATIGAGRRLTTGLFFTGTLDEVAFYPAALSAARVTVHYQTAP